MKKYYLKKIYKIIGFIFTNLIIYGIIIGVISGLIVTFLFYTPKISLTDTYVKIEDDKIYFDFQYENKGQSPAINIEYIAKYAILYKNEQKYNGLLQGQSEQDKFEAGDIVRYTVRTSFETVGYDIFKNSEIIILCKVKYEDSSKFRNFINKRLLNNKYSIYRLTFYDVSKKEKFLSVIPLEKRNEFKEIIDKWVEE
ncbi:unnamed protein product, partial [marine sediment metagenome]